MRPRCTKCKCLWVNFPCTSARNPTPKQKSHNRYFLYKYQTLRTRFVIESMLTFGHPSRSPELVMFCEPRKSGACAGDSKGEKYRRKQGRSRLLVRGPRDWDRQ